MDDQKIRSRQKVQMFHFDPDATSATDVAWVDMRDFGRILCGFLRTVGTSDLTMKVIANSEPDGSGTDVEVKTKSFISQPDAAGDQVFMEVTAQEIAPLGDNLRYVSLSLAVATGTDEGIVVYVQGDSRFCFDGLTADSIA